MTAPVTAPVREDRINKLAQALTSLKGTSVVAEGGEASAFGLNAPSAAVKLTCLPPAEFRVEPAQEPDVKGRPDEAAAQPAEGETRPAMVKPVEVQPPAQTFDLAVAEHDGKFYAKRADRPAIVEVAKDFYDQLFAEFRTPEVLDFDPAKVNRLTLRDGEQTLAFVHKGATWQYEPAPDLPIDGKKLDALLGKAKDLKTERFVACPADDLARFGLASPQKEIVITTDDGGVRRLQISAQTSEGLPDKGHYATVEGRGEVFLLTPELVKTVTASLGELEKR